MTTLPGGGWTYGPVYTQPPAASYTSTFVLLEYVSTWQEALAFAERVRPNCESKPSIRRALFAAPTARWVVRWNPRMVLINGQAS